jgi:hypothetical protein
MSELTTLISSETDTRRIYKTLEDTTPWKGLTGCPIRLAGSTCRSTGLWDPLLASSFTRRVSTTLGFASTLSFQVGLIRGLRMDATTYIYQPLPPLAYQTLIQSVKKIETLILIAPPYSRA